MKRLCPCLYLLTVIGLLSACAPPPEAENQALSWQDRKAQLAGLSQWQIKGGLAVKKERKGFAATMHWRQLSPGHYNIHLFGPLGSGSVKLKNHQGKAIYTDGKKTVQTASAERLLFKQTGYHIPIHQMNYWLKGIPAPTSAARVSHDSYNHLSRLSQNGWQVKYLRFRAFKGVDLPTKIVMTHANLRIKVAINRWIF